MVMAWWSRSCNDGAVGVVVAVPLIRRRSVTGLRAGSLQASFVLLLAVWRAACISEPVLQNCDFAVSPSANLRAHDDKLICTVKLFLHVANSHSSELCVGQNVRNRVGRLIRDAVAAKNWYNRKCLSDKFRV